MDSFLDACGGAGPIRIHVEDRQGGVATDHILPQPFLVIGRHPRADLPLNHPDVSQRHGYLQMIGGRLYGVDLQSRTGTSWIGESGPSDGRGPVRGVGIGPYSIRFEMAVPPAGLSSGRIAVDDRLSPLSARFAKALPWPEVALEAVDSPAGVGGRRHVLRPVLTLIGRSPLCKVRLPGPSSQFAAALVRTPVGIWVVDLLSSDGIRVNGAQMRYAHLEEGDELGIQRHRLRLRYESRPAALPGAFEPPARREPQTTPPPERGLAPQIFSLPPSSVPMAPATAPAVPIPLSEVSQDLALRGVLDQLVQMQQQMYDQFHQVFALLPNLIVSLNQNHVELIREELAQIHRLSEEIKALREAAGPGPAPRAASSPARSPAPSPSPSPPPSAPVAEPASPAAELPWPGPEPLPSEPPTPLRDPQAVHEVVSDYLKAFEQERKGRWDKIMKLLLANGR
jgi:hypothetical protein